MAKGYVPIFFDWLDNTQDLSAEEKGHLIDAVVLYASGNDGWTEQLETPGIKIAFRFLRGQVDRNIEISKARAKAGANKPEQNVTNDNKPEQTGTSLPKKEKEEKENNNKNKEKEKEKFTPPTVEEVRQYCKERGNNIDPEHFVAYNENRDWKLSSGRKMKDWKLAVVTWEKNSFNQKPPVKVVPAQNYAQRDYSSEQEDAMRRMLKMGGA